MTVYFAQSSSNINAANVWNTAANGSGSYLTWPPASGDVLMANGRTITVNVDCNLGAGEVRTDAANEATTGGGFTLSSGVKLTANIYFGSGIAVTFSSPSPASASIVGNITGTTSYGAYNSNTGTLNITGNALGGSGGSAFAIYNTGNGTINVVGNITGGNGGNANGAQILNGILNLVGNAIGGAGITAYGILCSSGATTNITGDAIGGIGSLSYGFSNSGTLNLNGSAIGNEFGNGSVGFLASPGVWGSQNSLTLVKKIQYGSRGQSPTAGNVFVQLDAAINAAIFVKSDLTTVAMTPADRVDAGHAATSNVRAGVSYALGNLTGTCHVPAANQVSAGVAVDATVGTAALTAAAIRTELATELGRIDASISSRSTLTTGDLPSIPSAATIADAVRTELTTELDTITAINDRIELQVPEGPVVVVPAPSAGQTTAYTICYDEAGLPEENVTISLRLHSTGTATSYAWDGTELTETSNAEGVVSFSIPRNDGLRFQVRRGNGPWVKFSGVDAATLELPAIINTLL